MPSGRTGLAALVIGATLLVSLAGGLGAQEAESTPEGTPQPPPPATTPQPSYDVLRLQHEGAVVPYHIWFEWMPVLVTTPDGGGWAFFSAQARPPAGLQARRLYAARFDPERHVWLPAQPLPGGQIQFGPAAVVDQDGVVHVVFCDRATDTADAYSTLLYTRTNGRGGWETPIVVAPDPNAGHQMMPALAVDAGNRLHLLWRDQRLVSPEARAALPANADLFASDLVDGSWTVPVQVNNRPSPDVNVGWPLLAIDGDRLVAVWSVYKGTTEEEMRTAIRVDWSTRPLDDPNEWARSTMLVDRGDGEIGGLFIDLAADVNGGLVLLYGRFHRTSSDLFLRRLDPGAADWGADLALSAGDYGYLPSLDVAPDGTAYVVFNNGRNRGVEVGALALPAGATTPTPVLALTPAEDGLQARAAVAIAADGTPWVIYMYQAIGSSAATEIRSLRGAQVE